MEVKRERAKAGLQLNIKKTKVMTIEDVELIKVGNEN